MLTKIYEVTCDYCGEGINHFLEITKEQTMQICKERYFVKNGKVFCDEECYKRYCEEGAL